MDVKEHNTYEEQINKLIERGCEIKSQDYAVNVLKRVNYYRLSAYFLPFKQSDGSYMSDTNLERISGIYEFDKRLTVMLCGLIEEIEVFIKTQIAYYYFITFKNFKQVQFDLKIKVNIFLILCQHLVYFVEFTFCA